MENKDLRAKAQDYIEDNGIDKNTCQVEKAFIDGAKMALNQGQSLHIDNVSVPKGTVCCHCGGSGWDNYPSHDTTMRPCPECQP